MAFNREFHIGIKDSADIPDLETIARKHGFQPIAQDEEYFQEYREDIIGHQDSDGPALRYSPFDSPGTGIFFFREWPPGLTSIGDADIYAGKRQQGAILTIRSIVIMTWPFILQLPPGKERTEEAMLRVVNDESWYRAHCLLQAYLPLVSDIFAVQNNKAYERAEINRRPYPAELPEAHKAFEDLMAGRSLFIDYSDSSTNKAQQ